MLRVDELPVGQEPEPGQVYMVPCVDATKCRPGPAMPSTFAANLSKMVAIPVLGPRHRDPEFPGAGGERDHWHIDLRFATNWELEVVWNNSARRANEGSTTKINFPIMPAAEPDLSPLPRLHVHEKMCFRKLADFRGINIGSGYEAFEDGLEGRSIDLARPRCLHHGTDLSGQAVRDGVVTCPLHGANWCAKTGLFRRKTRMNHNTVNQYVYNIRPELVRCEG